MPDKPIRLAIVAGEESGDNLGADLVDSITALSGRPVQLIGVGGKVLQERGLQSLFDPSEIALMGFSAVVSNLPRLVQLIGKTAAAIAAARPDVLVIIDSPDFTHRVARKVKAKLPRLPVIDYVSPSVWAWRQGRAKAMTAYVDHVLAILPFEPKVLAELGGPPTTYVGHPLAGSDHLAVARARQETRKRGRNQANLLVLPGSRRSEVERLMDPFGETIALLAGRGREWRVIIPTVGHVEKLVRERSAKWAIKPDIVTTPKAKWRAFGEADAALAASGTVLLELALAGVPAISNYRTDWIVRRVLNKVPVWSAALPNLIAGYPVVPEYYNEFVRPQRLAREVERLAADTPERFAQLAGYGHVRAAMATTQPSGMLAARIVLDHIAAK